MVQINDFVLVTSGRWNGFYGKVVNTLFSSGSEQITVCHSTIGSVDVRQDEVKVCRNRQHAVWTRDKTNFKYKIENRTDLIIRMIRKIQPSVAELTTGCRVVVDEQLWTIAYATGDCISIFRNNGMDKRFPMKNQIQMILGRPIRLADILYAYRQLEIIKEKQGKETHSSVYLLLMGVWNPHYDDLECQSPKSILTIFNILEPLINLHLA